MFRIVEQVQLLASYMYMNGGLQATIGYGGYAGDP